MIQLFFMLLLLSFTLSVHATSCAPSGNCQAQGLISYTPNGHASCPTCVSTCPPGTYVVNGYASALCVSQYSNNNNQICVACQGNQGGNLYSYPYYPSYNMNMPWFYSMNVQPWWVTQGQFYYPNFNYPGAWQNNGIHAQHYPGNNEAVALKPNIYVEHKGYFTQDFKISFDLKEKMEFLATTPKLTNFSWEGEVKGEKFTVNKVAYDYLFYDARFDHTKLQFEHGACVDKDGLVSLMLKNLKEMTFTQLALKDFEEHWNIKIPSYPFYCVYPQYNKELDVVSPLKFSPEEAHIVRVLFMVVPHEKSPKTLAGQFPQLPNRSIAAIIPLPKEAKTTFYEWGVGFLSSDVVKP